MAVNVLITFTAGNPSNANGLISSIILSSSVIKVSFFNGEPSF